MRLLDLGMKSHKGNNLQRTPHGTSNRFPVNQQLRIAKRHQFNAERPLTILKQPQSLT